MNRLSKCVSIHIHILKVISHFSNYFKFLQMVDQPNSYSCQLTSSKELQLHLRVGFLFTDKTNGCHRGLTLCGLHQMFGGLRLPNLPVALG